MGGCMGEWINGGIVRGVREWAEEMFDGKQDECDREWIRMSV